MKLTQRLLLLPIIVVVILILFGVIQSKLKYNALKEKYKVLYKENVDMKVQQKMKIKFKPINLKNMKKVPPQMRVRKKNHFQELHPYSLFNPNFRKFMEWPPLFTTLFPKNQNLAEIMNVTITPNMTSWEKFNLQISKLHVYEENSEVVQQLLHDMHTQKIVAVEPYDLGGLQFKLIVTYENGGKALFKPRRFSKSFDGVYKYNGHNILYITDFERHHSEIAAFHLDRILGFRKVPPAVGRRINITGELYPLAFHELEKTIFYSPDGNYCFHGGCPRYCHTEHAFCGDPDMIEGSFSAWLEYSPHILFPNSIRHPWKRSYKTNVKAVWEEYPDFCEEEVKENPPFDDVRRIYDMVDAAIFDFLIGNMDRNTFEYYDVFGDDAFTTYIHFDNGKGFGQANLDELSILSPLTQCCIVRLSTFNKLYNFYIGAHPLSDLMRESLSEDPLAPVLSEPHLQALDRRVEITLLAIHNCVKANSAALVFHDDIV